MIRFATAKDLDAVEPLGRKFFEEAKHPGTWNGEHWKQTWSRVMELAGGFVLLWEEDGKLVGFLGGMLSQDPFSGEHVASENFWFVDPAHRKGLGAIRLLAAFEQHAKSAGCDRIYMVHLASLTPGALERLYQRRGYELVEQTFRKNLWQ